MTDTSPHGVRDLWERLAEWFQRDGNLACPGRVESAQGDQVDGRAKLRVTQRLK